MRLRHIEVLHAIKQTGSISAAATALSITQPAISKILKHAEQQLGFPLFRRIRGRLSPTDEADILFVDVKKVFEALDQTRHAAKMLRDGLEMHLRIVCLPSLGIGVVPRAIRNFRKQRPRTTIEIASRHEPEMMRALLAREFDLGISFGPPQDIDIIPGIEALLISSGELVYVDHPDYAPPKRNAPIRLSEIDRERFIGLNARHYLGISLRAALEREGVSFVPPIQVQTYSIARTLVASGAGCAVIDEFTAANPHAEIVVRPIVPTVRFGVYVFTREQHPLSKHANEFLSCLRTSCQEGRNAAFGAVRVVSG